MGKYSDAADQAANETDKELQAEIKSLIEISADKIKALFPNELDQAEVNLLIQKVKKSTNRNECVTAIQAFALKASKDAVGVLKDGFQIAKKAIV